MITNLSSCKFYENSTGQPSNNTHYFYSQNSYRFFLAVAGVCRPQVSLFCATVLKSLCCSWKNSCSTVFKISNTITSKRSRRSYTRYFVLPE